MKVVSEAVTRSAGSAATGLPLPKVAQALIILQQQRHIADYDNSIHWERIDAVAQVDIAAEAFSHWRAIRHTNEAQDYLLALFLPKQTRS